MVSNLQSFPYNVKTPYDYVSPSILYFWNLVGNHKKNTIMHLYAHLHEHRHHCKYHLTQHSSLPYINVRDEY